LSIYSRGDRPIIQYNERIRWLSFGTPQPSVFDGRGLYVAQADRDAAQELAPRFSEFRKIAEIDRTRGGETITNYVIYLVAKPTQSVLD
jgi:hypothetical protein